MGRQDDRTMGGSPWYSWACEDPDDTERVVWAAALALGGAALSWAGVPPVKAFLLCVLVSGRPLGPLREHVRALAPPRAQRRCGWAPRRRGWAQRRRACG